MKRRLLAAAAALVLVVVGAMVLVAYARGADRRALAGMATVQVLVVADPIAAGTPVSELGAKVRSEQLPVKAAAPGRVTSLSALAGRVATVDLQPGEQLLASRFASPSSLRAPGTVAVPQGDGELSIQLEPQRAVGGRLASGDKVGIYVSYKTPDGAGLTHVVLHGVLVTQVQGGIVAAKSADAGNGAQTAASAASLMITLALTSKEAEPVVWAMEHGTVWLSLEPDGTDTGGTTVVSPDDIYTGSFQ